MFGISAFSQSPFASLGGTPVQVDISRVAATASTSDPLNIPVNVDAEANVTPSGQAGTSGACLLYTSPSPRDLSTSRMPSSA